MGKRPQYSMVIQWSNDDRAYVVSLPEWSGRVLNPVTHGETYDEAVKNGTEAIEALIASSDQLGEPLPEPNVLRHIA
ncbi:MAG: type II toxin-antitoxin system HicB family antitoxin [Chloroflexota bacterium]|nr:type II toxin-antitoxin system HicB family antitoxin [Chloroflexota bacterium]